MPKVSGESRKMHTRTILAERIASVRSRIAAAAQRVGRDPAGITLVAVNRIEPGPADDTSGVSK